MDDADNDTVIFEDASLSLICTDGDSNDYALNAGVLYNKDRTAIEVSDSLYFMHPWDGSVPLVYHKAVSFASKYQRSALTGARVGKEQVVLYVDVTDPDLTTLAVMLAEYDIRGRMISVKQQTPKANSLRLIFRPKAIPGRLCCLTIPCRRCARSRCSNKSVV